MKTIIPFFEVNGKKYEITKTRYILAEYQKLFNENQLSNKDKADSIKVNALAKDVKRYLDKTKELEAIYFDTFDSEDERKYLKAKELYDTALEKLTLLEIESGCTTRFQKVVIDLLEQITIKSIAERYFDFDESKATEVWLKYTEEVGNDITVEWLLYMNDCIFNSNDERHENSFLAQMRKKLK